MSQPLYDKIWTLIASYCISRGIAHYATKDIVEFIISDRKDVKSYENACEKAKEAIRMADSGFIKADIEAIDELLKDNDSLTMKHEFEAWERIKKHISDIEDQMDMMEAIH